MKGVGGWWVKLTSHLFPTEKTTLKKPSLIRVKNNFLILGEGDIFGINGSFGAPEV